jgi:hypothetical protein
MWEVGDCLKNLDWQILYCLPKMDMMKFHENLKKYGSFKEVAKQGLYSRATLYRYRDRFKKIGITEATIWPEKHQLLPNVVL